MKNLEIIHQWQLPPAWHPPHKKMLQDEVLANFSKIGVTSLQSYLAWGEIEKKPGQVDFSFYDSLVEKLREHNLKWVPFLLLGQDYATPKWFKDSEESVYFKCLQHKKESKAQSIWNPNLPKYVGGFLKIVSEHYQDKKILESILLGVSGDWGEAIFSAGGGYYSEEFHTHADFWCADSYALKSFQEFAWQKYKSLKEINNNWGTNFQSEKEISFPPFQKQKITIKDNLFKTIRKAPNWLKVYLRMAVRYYQKASGENRDFLSQDQLFFPKTAENDAGRRYWLDFVKWYFESMVNFSEFWLKSARAYFPDVDIYLVTGGNGSPQLGADFSVQTKIASKYNAGIRITNQGDNYVENFVLTRLVSSAAKFYDNYYTTEGINSDKGTIARLFDAVSSGARGIYYWNLIGWGKEPYSHQNIPAGCLTKGAENLKENIKYFDIGRPIVDVAVFFPNATITLHPQILDSFYKKCVKLRDVFDFDLVDETMIKDGALNNYRYLLALETELPKENIPSNIKIVYDSKEIPNKIDNEHDGVYATRFEDKIMYYNSNNKKVIKKVKLLDKTIEIEPNSISTVNI